MRQTKNTCNIIHGLQTCELEFYLLPLLPVPATSSQPQKEAEVCTSQKCQTWTNTRTWGVLPFLGKCKSQLRGVMARDGQLGWNKTWALLPWKSWPSQWRHSQPRTAKGRRFIRIIDKWSQFKCPQIPTSSSWLPVIRLHFNTIPTPILQEHCYEEHGTVNPGLVGTSLFVFHLNYFYDILLALKWFWKNLEVPK